MRLLPRDFFALLRADCLVIRGEPRFDAHAAHERVLLDLWVHLKFRVDKRLMCLVAGEIISVNYYSSQCLIAESISCGCDVSDNSRSILEEIYAWMLHSN